MALSNIFREPRREITESVIGVLALVPFCGLDWLVAKEALGGWKNGWEMVGSLVFATIVIFLAALALAAVLAITHEIGEWVCDRMRNAGFDPRPKDRPGSQQREYDW